MTGREHGGTGSLRFRLPRGCEPLTLKSLAQWLASLDEPGSTDRRTVTLTRIIDEARWALEGSGHDEQTDDMSDEEPLDLKDVPHGPLQYEPWQPDPRTVAALAKWAEAQCVLFRDMQENAASEQSRNYAEGYADAMAEVLRFGSSVSGGEHE